MNSGTTGQHQRVDHSRLRHCHRRECESAFGRYRSPGDRRDGDLVPAIGEMRRLSEHLARRDHVESLHPRKGENHHAVNQSLQLLALAVVVSVDCIQSTVVDQIAVGAVGP